MLIIFHDGLTSFRNTVSVFGGGGASCSRNYVALSFGTRELFPVSIFFLKNNAVPMKFIYN
jgi:hypothetical protein